jgi:integrase/recombinase XerC
MQASVQSFFNYIEFEKRYSKHTIEAYQNDLAQFETFLITYEKELKDVSHIDIRNWIVSMMEQKISARSVNRKISALKSFYKFLLRRGEIKKTPLSKVQTPKTSKRLPVFVELPGIEKLLKEIEFPEGYEGLRDKMIIELFYGTGMRRSELINLKETDIDSYNSQIKVLGKGNKERIIPIHNELRNTIKNFIQRKKELLESQSGDLLVVREKGKKMEPGLVYEIVKKYLNLVTTVDKKSPHTLRHTFATHLMNNGADINAVKELLGHASLAATQVYTHNTIDKLKEIYNRAHPKA